VEVDNAALSLACLARVYHGASAEDASALARKAIDVAGVDADEVDLIDALDDVWAASMVAGVFVRTPFEHIFPLSPKEESILEEETEDGKRHLAETLPDEDHFIPKRYKDKSLVFKKKNRVKKRRHWDKNDATLERK